MVQEIKIDLFKYVKTLESPNNKIFILHCISHDLKMGAGIAKSMQNKFSIREKAPVLRPWEEKGFAFITSGNETSCHESNFNIINLVTKELYWHKPTYDTLKQSLISAQNIIFEEMNGLQNKSKIAQIVMPKIGCGLDRLDWSKVLNILLENFNTYDATVCCL